MTKHVALVLTRLGFVVQYFQKTINFKCIVAFGGLRFTQVNANVEVTSLFYSDTTLNISGEPQNKGEERNATHIRCAVSWRLGIAHLGSSVLER